MQGRQFLDLARQYLSGGTEVHWRGAVGRTYYALRLECWDALFHWGFQLPPRDNVHTFVRLRLTFAADADLKLIGMTLDKLCQLRNRADYELSSLAAFSSDAVATNAVQESSQRIDLLDAIDKDAARQATAIAAIQKAFP
jgi:hypothetical protein